MTIASQAKKDAAEYARARLFYGEGAGTRRKLINTAVEYKSAHIPGYDKLFMKEFKEQDMLAHAEAAVRERKRKDVTKKVDRNVRGLISGNAQSLTTGVAVLAGAWYIAKETGADKEIIKYVKIKYGVAKSKYVMWKAARHNTNVYTMNDWPQS